MINSIFNSLYAIFSQRDIRQSLKIPSDSGMKRVVAFEKEGEQAMQEPVAFTWSGALLGVRRSIPLVLSVCTYGIAFGVLARQAGLSLIAATLMSTLVRAGASQLVVLGLWSSSLPVVSIIFTTLLVNLRFLLMGAALRPWFAQLSPLKAYGSLSFLGDESWALTMQELTEGKQNAAFLVGCGLVLNIAWIGATIGGYLLGAIIGKPEQWGLDFAFTATFLALLMGMWKGKTTLLPWAVAAAVAIVSAHWLPGKWYILLGGLAGSIIGAILYAE